MDAENANYCRRIDEVQSQLDDKGRVQFDPESLIEALGHVIAGIKDQRLESLAHK